MLAWKEAALLHGQRAMIGDAVEERRCCGTQASRRCGVNGDAHERHRDVDASGDDGRERTVPLLLRGPRRGRRKTARSQGRREQGHQRGRHASLCIALEKDHTEIVVKLIEAKREQGHQRGRHAAVHRPQEGPHRDCREAARCERRREPGRRTVASRRCSSPAKGPHRDRHEADRCERRREPQNDNGCTPLYVACGEGHTEVVAPLLAANANVNQADNELGRCGSLPEGLRRGRHL